ncbi:MAG: hypothetical protein AAF974_00580 [Cyanobacteria bacterium P01_E01_bin.34]
MSSSHIGGIPIAPPRNNLLSKYVYYAKATGFTFQFTSPEQCRSIGLLLAENSLKYKKDGASLRARLAALVLEAPQKTAARQKTCNVSQSSGASVRNVQ